jgi:23S rRNA (adenine2503-C2)-methyltransferase
MNKKTPLFGKTLAELESLAQEHTLPRFTAKQIADWLYKKDVTSIPDMTNLSTRLREQLAERYEFGIAAPDDILTSSDGTRKYLFPTAHGRSIETAMIPMNKRRTVCISSQVGCKMGCSFCMTGMQGFQGQLTAGEIVNQIRSIPERHEVTNVVYMGMGEPFDNIDEVLKSIEILTADWGFAMSPRRITVSSIGMTPALTRFLSECEAHLAISLHSPFEEERTQLMPAQTTHPFERTIDAIRQWDFSGQRRVSFEYVVFGELNDTHRHVDALARLLDGIPCHLNLIRFHPIPGSSLPQTNETRLETFKDELNRRGLFTTIRASRGIDISAACGLLSTQRGR